MAASSLRYRPNATAPEERKFGYGIFDGRPTEYHHWLFRTQLEAKAAKKEDVPQVLQYVVENSEKEGGQPRFQFVYDVGTTQMQEVLMIGITRAKEAAYYVFANQGHSNKVKRGGAPTLEAMVPGSMALVSGCQSKAAGVAIVLRQSYAASREISPIPFHPETRGYAICIHAVYWYVLKVV